MDFGASRRKEYTRTYQEHRKAGGESISSFLMKKPVLMDIDTCVQASRHRLRLRFVASVYSLPSLSQTQALILASLADAASYL